MPDRPRRSPLFRLAAVIAVTGGVLLPASSPAAAGPSCGGVVPMKASGVPWVCTFDDEFNGKAVNRDRWTVQRTAAGGFRAGAACVVDSKRTVSVSKGHLNLTVRRTATPFACKTPGGSFTTSWKAGSIYSRHFGQAYGRFAIRARFPQAHGISGLQSALWTYPRDMTLNKAVTGTKEIDIAEAYSRWPDLVSPTVHTFLGGSTGTCDVPDYAAGYHTYAVVWTPTNAVFYYDGVRCFAAGHTGTSQPFLIALTQGLGVRPNAYSNSTPMPARMQVAWVRVWK